MDEYLKKWLIKAFEDYKLIENELKLPDEKIPTSAVCFHCQQFVEKLLKAFLVYNKKDFGKTYDLKLLLKLCKDIDKSFNEIDVGNLDFYSVEIRYPDEFYIPTVSETKNNYETVKKIKEFIIKKLNIDEAEIQKNK